MRNISIPKSFMNGIVVPSGPLKGNLAEPCLCGYETDLEGDRTIYLIRWHDGTLMFAHKDCVGGPDDA